MPERTKLAGLGGIIGGLGIAAVSFGQNAFSIDPRSLGFATITIAYVLLVVTLLAAHSRYRTDYGWVGRAVVALLMIGLAGLAVNFALNDLLARGVLSGIKLGVTFVLLRLLGSVFGLVLWRNTTINRVASGLFVAIFPAFIVFIALTASSSIAGAVFEVVFYVAFAALGYDLWTTSRTTRSVVGGTR